jgi:outer membrane protein
MIIVASLCALGFTGELAWTATKKSFRVGVIDPQAVIEKSKAGSRALAGLKEHAQARETVMKNDQKELEKLQEELEASKNKLSAEEQNRKQERFSQRFQEWQKRGQEFQAELGQKQKELVQEYMKKIQEATSIVAKRHGFDIVIDKGSENTLKIALYHRDGLDLTNEVVKEFNKRFK